MVSGTLCLSMSICGAAVVNGTEASKETMTKASRQGLVGWDLDHKAEIGPWIWGRSLGLGP